ncbi:MULTISPECIES: M23 family metallopeptidase [Streptomyces]|uniref:M23 family metallopeptidase n=1 Tax=Streptomyces TaxID=1883 RepID=UPI0009982C84|nr:MULTISPECIES: M23 family metallopeptidase [Streptomyces]
MAPPTTGDPADDSTSTGARARTRTEPGARPISGTRYGRPRGALTAAVLLPVAVALLVTAGREAPGTHPAPGGHPGQRAATAAAEGHGVAGVPARPASVSAVARAGWVRPVALRNVRISQPYGIKGNWAAGHHTGIDLAVPMGTPVRSVGPGTVVYAGWSGAYGRAVTIRMRDRKYTLFAHLSQSSVTVGERVGAGTWIGRSGNSGRTTGPHLHFEVRARRGYGSDIDPVRYLARHGVRLG